MQVSKFFALSSMSVIVFDAVASIASIGLGFSYTYATVGSAVLYIGLSYFASRRFGFLAALLLGAVMGLTDVTLGWAVSWAIGPGRISIDTFTPMDFFYTAAFAIILGVVFGLIGGSVGALVGRWRAA